MHSTRIFAALIFAVGTAATCGKDLYGAEAQRREVSVTIRIANLI